DPFREDVSLLYANDHGDKHARFSERFTERHYETPIIKGVVNQLRKWPADLFFAFLAACLIVASLVFLIFVTVAICVPTVVGNSIENFRIEGTPILEGFGASPNVYFFKLANQNWSTKEFCYIETAARRHPDFNVYLINLMKDEPITASSNEPVINRTRLESASNDSNSYRSPMLTPEDRLRQRLAHENGNIRNMDVSVDKFFRGSKLSKIAKILDEKVLEMAARAQLLWSVPGVALRPNMFCTLDTVKSFLCNNRDECLPDKMATVEPENDIQLTGVPCQAFMGFIVHEISRNYQNKNYTWKEATERYCPRLNYCPEIRILDSKPKCPTDAFDCPVVYSSIVMHVT
ncbi:hypothetical protein WH47_09323, partial [Habropoda laboriosa]